MLKKNVHLDIDPGLWRDFKAACAYYNISMKATLIKHIQNIVNDYRKDRTIYDIPKVYKHKEKKR